MKRIMILIFVMLMATMFVSAMEVPDEPNQVVINKIDAEHKTTRQFISSELKNRETEFIGEFTKRADYYEQSFIDLSNKAVLKLGLLWSGILIFFVAFNKYMNTKTEAKKYEVLKNALKKDIIDEINFQSISLPQKDMDTAKELEIKRDTPKKSVMQKMRL